MHEMDHSSLVGSKLEGCMFGIVESCIEMLTFTKVYKHAMSLISNFLAFVWWINDTSFLTMLDHLTILSSLQILLQNMVSMNYLRPYNLITPFDTITLLDIFTTYANLDQ